MKKFLTVFLLFVVLLSVQMVIAGTTIELIAKGDSAFTAMDNAEALKNYMLAFNEDNSSCEAMWKVSRAYTDLGESADEAKQKNYYAEGEKFAKMAVEKCPNDANAHLYLSVAIGRVALISGKKEQVQLSKTVKEEAEIALKLDPNNDTAHHVLARWHRKVANLSGIQKTFAKLLYGGLPDASNEKAVEHFKAAIKLKPDHINHHLELGITFEEMAEWQNAKDEFTKVAAMPIKAADDNRYKQEAAKHLAFVEKKIK